ncbi:MAG: peptidoglycan bridge formation glycyltransferase FemA/FemB family protein [Pseudomonadales bacterium]|jgi:lipid II:glycine glycyltransferase (peptidoglycan interpeptide bridge formation enzyme)|nr:peptidoglycan bridge formation glycyltransferase FemA/FemB family protein [Pseudomonadales bacterium]
MLIRPIDPEEREIFDKAVDHPLQSWQWGEFKKEMGQKVERIGFFENDHLTHGLQMTFHQVPVLGGTVGYVPKGFMPDLEQMGAIKQIAKKHQAIFVKIEPNVAIADSSSKVGFEAIDKFILKNGGVRGKPLFTKYNFHLSLQNDIETLFNNLNSKTRYNVRLAMKKGVQIIEDTSDTGMETYIKLMGETTKRQGFYNHTPEYFRKMWKVIGRDQKSMLHIFHAVYENTVLVSWIVFVFNGKLYYPYGASSDAHREVMASNLMMWEAINYGHENGCTSFDMWGALGPNEAANHKHAGFHRFKQSYAPTLMENVGTYDLVYNQLNYTLFNVADKLRWVGLKLTK